MLVRNVYSGGVFSSSLFLLAATENKWVGCSFLFLSLSLIVGVDGGESLLGHWALSGCGCGWVRGDGNAQMKKKEFQRIMGEWLHGVAWKPSSLESV